MVLSRAQRMDQLREIVRTVLFVPIGSIGHINSMLGIANLFRNLEHRTVFLLQEPLGSELNDSGHEIYDCSLDNGLTRSSLMTPSRESIIESMGDAMRDPTIEKTVGWIKRIFEWARDLTIKVDPIFARKLALIEPDIIILDHYFVQPAILKYGKPWALVYSASPLSLYPPESNLPAPFLGIPLNYMETDKKDEYLALGKAYHQARGEVWQSWLDYLEREHQFKIPDGDMGVYLQMSPHLNIYQYPLELDYGPGLDDYYWNQCDSFIRYNDNMNEIDPVKEIQIDPRYAFELPEKLRNKSGKLIYLSMGTIASSDVQLMQRLVAMCAKSPHRFIVSCGPKMRQYELPDNMWGERYVNQLSVLPHIDLIITHCGNNTLVECCYFGVPGFIGLPAFTDQKDNAQRIVECNIGKRLDPFKCTEKEFLDAIETVLNDSSIKTKMRQISHRMQKKDNRYRALYLTRDFVEIPLNF